MITSIIGTLFASVGTIVTIVSLFAGNALDEPQGFRGKVLLVSLSLMFAGGMLLK